MSLKVLWAHLYSQNEKNEKDFIEKLVNKYDFECSNYK
ncbi:hypothetical protein M087_0565 [Bacteroides fragilis str. S23 R14]|nr:hypothetical protein M087_0565 [Bacteroides fragilis str. S23 R14]EYA68037.1 hypothetical protein M139_0610 [Bacteroides fragilis str. S23L24]EYE48177.1 hypothetical protein M138_0577 [Bacteroides fragilis str. S23L17]